jgi:hypothetical protein
MYHWRKVLRREGRWQEAPEERPGHGSRRGAAAPDFTREPVRFARVKLEQNAPVCSLTIRVMFTNGRRAEIDLGDTQSLREVLDCLEHSA